MFAQRHYVAIAEVVDSLDYEGITKEDLVAALARMLAADNQNFDLAKFKKACGM